MKKKTDTTDIPAFKVSKFCLFTSAPIFTTFFETFHKSLGLGRCKKFLTDLSVAHFKSPGEKSHSYLKFRMKFLKKN